MNLFNIASQLICEFNVPRNRSITVYRGEESLLSKFKNIFLGRSKNTANIKGYWFTDSFDAASYEGDYVKTFAIVLINPFIVTNTMLMKHSNKGLFFWVDTAQDLGHDSVVVEGLKSGAIQSNLYCVFNKSQIKLIK